MNIEGAMNDTLAILLFQPLGIPAVEVCHLIQVDSFRGDRMASIAVNPSS